MSSSKSFTCTIFVTGLRFSGGCADPGLDADFPAFGVPSNAEDGHSINILPEITSENHPQFKCPPSPEPCVIPTCGIQSIVLTSLQNNSSCDCDKDVNFLWTAKAPEGIVEGSATLSAKSAKTVFFVEDSIPLKIKSVGNNMYEISNAYPVSVGDAAYDNSTTWQATLRLKTNCPKRAYSEAKVDTLIKKTDLSPCQRNDKIGWAPGIVGTGLLICWGSCDFQYTPPTHHKIDIFDVTGGINSFVNSELVGAFDIKDVPYLQAGRSYRFEYRNVVYSNNVKQCESSTPFVEMHY